MVITDVAGIDDVDEREFAWFKLRAFQDTEWAADHLCRLHMLPTSARPNARRMAEQVRVCLLQAQEYFEAARHATLATRPVLLYYGMMSFAIAEVLVKQDGESRIERLREKHNAHGLKLSVDGKIDSTVPLKDLGLRLHALPQTNSAGRFGTFEVWRRSVRESPVPAKFTGIYPAAGGSQSGPRVAFKGTDVEQAHLPDSGHSLLSALRVLPQLEATLAQFNLNASLIRATLNMEIHFGADGSKSGRLQMIVHPGPPGFCDAFCSRIKFRAEAVNLLQIAELPNGIILTVPIQGDEERELIRQLPPAVTLRDKFSHFCVDDWSLGEGGAFYIALHICGNLARYYPEIWMRHIERASQLCMVVERLCEVALRRVPLLAAMELHRVYIRRDQLT